MASQSPHLIDALCCKAETVAGIVKQQEVLEEVARRCSRTSSSKPSAAELKIALDSVVGTLSIYSSPPLVESLAHSRLYATLLSAMTALIPEVKQSYGLNVASLVGSLRAFWTYGTSAASAVGAPHKNSPQTLQGSSQRRPTYQPPQRRARNARLSDGMGSDSDTSDSEGLVGSGDRLRSSKARLAALTCLQALAKRDARSLQPCWPDLLPVYFVYATRQREVTLVDVLTKDPSLKVRLAAGVAICSLLEGAPQKAYLAIAEHRVADKHSVRGFTTLSATLGQLVVTTHHGLFQAVEREASMPVLASSLRALAAVAAAAPYARLPTDLLPRVVQAAQQCLGQCSPGSASSRTNAATVQSAALSCLATAFSGRGPHRAVAASLSGSSSGQGLLRDLLQKAQSVEEGLAGSGSSCAESLAALRAVAVNYPCALVRHWDWIFRIAANCARLGTGGDGTQEQEELATARAVRLVSALLASCGAARPAEPGDDSATLWQGHAADAEPMQSRGDSQAQASQEDAQHLLLMVNPQRCAQVFGQLFPQAVGHPSGIVRAAAFGLPAVCSADMYERLPPQTQSQVLDASLTHAESDSIIAVRSAAAKAVANFSTFQQLTRPPALGMLALGICGALGDAAISVRAQAAAALANLAEGLRRVSALTAAQQETLQQITAEATAAAALRAATDSEKVSINALRALGNLLVAAFTGCPANGKQHLLEALRGFDRALAEGTFKAQWNVCYGLGALLRVPAAAAALEGCDELPALLLRVAGIASASPNFKSRMHAAAALSAVGSPRLCGPHVQEILQQLRAAVEEARNSAFSRREDGDSSAQRGGQPGPLDFRSLPAMKEQLQIALAHFHDFAA